MFKVINRTSLKPGDPRYDDLLSQANAKANRFLAYNPSRRDTTYITLSWGRREYKAHCKYTSNQGTSTFAIAYTEARK